MRITKGMEGGWSNGDCSTHSGDKTWYVFGVEMGHSPTHSMKSTHARIHTSGSGWFHGAHRGQGRGQGCQ